MEGQTGYWTQSTTNSTAPLRRDIHVVDHFSGDGFARNRAALVAVAAVFCACGQRNALDMRCIRGMDFRPASNGCMPEQTKACTGVLVRDEVDGGNDAPGFERLILGIPTTTNSQRVSISLNDSRIL